MKIQEAFRTIYEEGRSFASTALKIEQVSECPYLPVEAGHPDCGKRQTWMCGFLDARFQAICDKHNLGKFGENDFKSS
jgi:hypothetical protein